jgi:CBS domain-containing protein
MPDAADPAPARPVPWPATPSAAAALALAQQTLETPLGRLARRPPVAVAMDTPLAEALALMHERHVGSVFVVDSKASAVVRGILTRHDILGRVTLPQLPLSTAIAHVMTSPVHTLTVTDTALDAAQLMSQHGMRHVPVTQDGRLVGAVSERDLFQLQRLSIHHVGAALQAAADVPALRAAAADIRDFATQLLVQGVQARQLTALVSQLNDRLTARLVALLATQHGLDMDRACWLAFGSEGREEQTLATDQDNGLVFSSATPDADRPRWLAFGQAVNQALDDCGYPLCRGGVMAGQPACCLSEDEWREHFASWMEHGAPQDLLHAAIFFDLRPLAGRLALAAPLREFIALRASATPRFLRQMAHNTLGHRAPLNWHGALAGDSIDLKLQGTGLFVEAARLLALAAGSRETSTRRRFEALAGPLHIPVVETAAWAAAFEHLQALRLAVQVAGGGAAGANRCDIGALSEIDRRLLRDSLHVLQRLQQRIELDYLR